MQLDEITGTIVVAAINLHREIGPGLFESAYESILAADLQRRGLRVRRQCPISFSYEEVPFDNAFHVDLLVEKCVIVELKSVEKLAPVHRMQLLTYLRLSHLRIGLLLNFGTATMKEGIKRVVNDLPPAASPRLRVNQPSPQR
jgi:iron complex transport system substrate-binding protein